MISATCTFDANGGKTSAAGRVGRTKFLPASVRYEYRVIVRPSRPSVLPYAPLSTPVAFWFSNLCMLLMDSK
eukprot:13225728-Ditylum_brightwellii.AAC.1